MTLLLEAKQKVKWNDALRKIYTRYPSAYRSKAWPEIVQMALSGDVDGAKAKAKEVEDGSVSARIENSSANALRLKRVALFARFSRAERQLRVIFNRLGDALEKKVAKKATGVGKIPSINKEIDLVTKELRRELNKWLRSVIKDSALLGLKNPGEAFEDSFKAAKEGLRIVAIESFLIAEARKIPLKNVGNSKAKINTTTQKFRGITQRVVKTILTSNLSGQDPRDRVVELTQRMRNEMRRVLANDIAQGKGPDATARDIKKFISPQIVKAVERGEVVPRGTYRSTFKNAMRIARTEGNKAYTHASAEWAKGKSFIKGIQVTLSPMHGETDICDEYAAKGVLSPDEFKSLIPAHPHCMCYPTYIYEDRFLDKEAA